MSSNASTLQSRLTAIQQLRLTDSPWLWLTIFSLAGLMGSFAIGPKYVQREGRLERMQQARQTVDIWDGAQTAARRDAADAASSPDGSLNGPVTAVPAESLKNPPLNVPLQPLSWLFLSLAFVGVIGLLWSLRRHWRLIAAGATTNHAHSAT